MKVKLESSKELQYPGITLTSENQEEKQRLLDIYIGKGGIASFGKLPDGNVELTITPTPQKQNGT
jgi:hypothetical protein